MCFDQIYVFLSSTDNEEVELDDLSRIKSFEPNLVPVQSRKRRYCWWICCCCGGDGAKRSMAIYMRSLSQKIISTMGLATASEKKAAQVTGEPLPEVQQVVRNSELASRL